MGTAERVDQTNRLLDLLEAGDQEGMADILDEEVVWRTPMTSDDGEDGEVARGREAFGSRLGFISGQMTSARFTGRRITTSADGATTFVQTRGDFVTKAGRPYRNVYVFRFDWRDGRVVSWEEYANPLAVMRAFPEQYGHLPER
jgi:ketosteroid isomerase-like protein